MSTVARGATDGAKMLYLIKRKPATSREELIAHWFANHMPGVVAAQHEARAAGRRHAFRYIATLFDPPPEGEQVWDGVAQLWFEHALGKPDTAIGTTPTDTFQEKAEPYMPWATTEYVVLDGAEHLPVTPLTLNDPFPCTRSGFLKITYLVIARPGTDFDALFAHWLNVHAPNMYDTMTAAGGFRYVVSHSLHPAEEPYAGMAELYFPDAGTWLDFQNRLQPDGLERWLALEKTVMLSAGTEMIGIP